MADQTFPKHERIKSRKLISALFREGRKVRSQNLLLLYLEQPVDSRKSPVQFGVTVAKRNVKRAVDRNRIKRLVREAYRKQKSEFIEQLGVHKRYALFVVYLSHDILPYAHIENQMSRVLQRWLQSIS